MLTKKERIFNICSLICNLTVFALGFIAIVLRVVNFQDYGNGINDSAGGAFRFFTVDGNLYCVIAAAVMLVFNVFTLVKKQYKVPFWAYMMKLASAVTGVVVFLVVMVAIIGGIGEVKILGYVMFTLHVVNPTLCIVSFLVFERTDKKVNLKQTLLGAIPVFTYAIIAIILCASKAWVADEIPYPFLDVHANPVWQSILYFIGIVGGAWAFSVLFSWLNKIITQKCFGNANLAEYPTPDCAQEPSDEINE